MFWEVGTGRGNGRRGELQEQVIDRRGGDGSTTKRTGRSVGGADLTGGVTAGEDQRRTELSVANVTDRTRRHCLHILVHEICSFHLFSYLFPHRSRLLFNPFSLSIQTALKSDFFIVISGRASASIISSHITSKRGSNAVKFLLQSHNLPVSLLPSPFFLCSSLQHDMRTSKLCLLRLFQLSIT